MLSFLYGPTLTLTQTSGNPVALTVWTFVSKVMPLLFNMLPRFVIAFLPGRKYLLISCLQSLSAVILEPSTIKFATVSSFHPSIYIREPSNKDLSFRLTIGYAFSLLNNESRESLVVIINSLIETAFYTSNAPTVYLIMESFLLSLTCRNNTSKQLTGRNKEALRLAWELAWEFMPLSGTLCSYISLEDLQNVHLMGS